MDKAKDFEKGWEEYKAKKNQEIKEMIGIIQNAVGGCAEHWAKLIAEELHKNRYRKIPENAVVLTATGMDERWIDLLIEFDEMGFEPTTLPPKDMSVEEYTAFYKARLLEVLANSCKETAERFAERVSQVIVDNTYPYFDKDGKPVNIWNAVVGFDKIDEIAKEITGNDKMSLKRARIDAGGGNTVVNDSVKNSGDLCVVCGGYVPEGRQVCPSCKMQKET